MNLRDITLPLSENSCSEYCEIRKFMGLWLATIAVFAHMEIPSASSDLTVRGLNKSMVVTHSQLASSAISVFLYLAGAPDVSNFLPFGSIRWPRMLTASSYILCYRNFQGSVV